jgi:prepilin-type N-terminal cleavage/methylation domain-containing protein
MKKLLKGRKGVTLLEVLIATAVMVILFSIFAMLISSAYRVNYELDANKQGRESQVNNFEFKVGSNNGLAEEVGRVNVKLKFSEAGLSKDTYGEGAVKDSDDMKCQVYRSADYGKDAAGNAGDKYIYAFRQ